MGGPSLLRGQLPSASSDVLCPGSHWSPRKWVLPVMRRALLYVAGGGAELVRKTVPVQGSTEVRWEPLGSRLGLAGRH